MLKTAFRSNTRAALPRTSSKTGFFSSVGRQSSSQTKKARLNGHDSSDNHQGKNPSEPQDPRTDRKTQMQKELELREKLENMSGEGGAAGVVYENGEAGGLGREVRRNMFRVI